MQPINLSKDQERILLEIYIGKNIRSEGILKRHFHTDQYQIINDLIELHFITEEKFSRTTFQVLKTTEIGNNKAKEFINKIILNNKYDLLKNIKTIPKPFLEFFLYDFESLLFAKRTDLKYFFNWKDYVLNNQIVFDNLNKLYNILKKFNLAIDTQYYVTTRGGEKRDRHIIIPTEIKEFLSINQFISKELDIHIKEKLKLFYLLYKLKEIINLVDIETRRRNYWSLLQELQLDEDKIKSLVDIFKKQDLTTEYKAVTQENFLFEIKDISRFDVFLEKLFNEFVTELSNEEVISEPRKEFVSKLKINPLLSDHVEAFAEIGNFELKIRTFILKRMQVEGENEWYDMLKEIKIRGANNEELTLYDNLKRREQEDIKNKFLPEKELLFYADIIHYKDIILKFWDSHFSKDFQKNNFTKEQLEHAIIEINKIRRQTMHLRELKKDTLKTIILFVIPQLNKVIEM